MYHFGRGQAKLSRDRMKLGIFTWTVMLLVSAAANTAAVVIVSAPTAFAEEKRNELDYSQEWCDDNDGIAEYKLSDASRIDCLTENLAVEHDWAKGGKPYECVGQALYYGAMSGRIPVCVLIRPDGQELSDFIRSTSRAIIGGGAGGVEVWCVNSKGYPIDCLTGE